jgi:hypothetical protein
MQSTVVARLKVLATLRKHVVLFASLRVLVSIKWSIHRLNLLGFVTAAGRLEGALLDQAG